MAVTVATLVAKLEADIRDFTRDMRRARGDVKDLDKASAGAAAGGMAKFKKAAAGVGGALAVAEGARRLFKMTQLAVDAEEAAAAFTTTFGPATQDVAAFVEEFANKAGFARFELEQMLAITGNVVQGLGGTEQQSAALSERMAILAGDVASFSNASGGAQAVLKALTSAINGEREALKTYGLAVSEVEVQQRALNTTGKKSVDELTRLDKALATVEVAYDKAGKAIGDLDRTSGSAANQQREIAAKFKEVQVAIGELLLPAWNKLLDVTSRFLDVTLLVIDAAAKLPSAFADIADAAKDAADSVPFVGEGLEIVGDQARRLIGFFPKTATVTKEAGHAFAELDEETRAAKWAMFNAQNQARDMALRLEGLRGSTHESASAFGELEGAEAAFVSHVLTQAIPAAQRYESAQRAAAERLDAQRRAAEEAEGAVRNLANAHRAAIDPVFRLFEAQDALEKAQARVIELQEQGDTSSREYDQAVRENIRTHADFKVALEDLGKAGPGVVDSFIAMAREAGVAEEDISKLAGELQEFADEANDLGLAIVNGILAGVQGLSGKLIAKLGPDIQHAIKVAKNDILHSSSPSRLTQEELGEPIRDGVIAGVDGLDVMLHGVLGSQLVGGIELGMSDAVLAIEKAQLALDRALERVAEAGKKALDSFDFRSAVIAVEDAKRGLLAAIDQTALEAEQAMQRLVSSVSQAGTAGMGAVFDPMNTLLRVKEAEIAVARAQDRLRLAREKFHEGEGTFLDVEAADVGLARAVAARIQAQVAAAGGPAGIADQFLPPGTAELIRDALAGNVEVVGPHVIAEYEQALAAHLQQLFNEAIIAARLPTFHSGVGRVPGPPGSEMLAVLEAGERVIPADQNHPVGGGDIYIDAINIQSTDPHEAAREVRNQLVKIGRRNGERR